MYELHNFDSDISEAIMIGYNPVAYCVKEKKNPAVKLIYLILKQEKKPLLLSKWFPQLLKVWSLNSPELH